MTNFDGYHLAEYARQVNQANGKPDSRNTQALGRVDGDVEMFTQRSYNTHEEQLDAIHTQTGGRVSVQTTHIADNKEDEGIHAEMLLVSEWLLGEIGRPSSVGASQPVCARCARVLTILGISHPQTDGHVTKNWVHPIRHAKYVDFNDELSARGLTSAEFASLTHDLPQKVTNKREYGW
jgi:hypothetical protein